MQKSTGELKMCLSKAEQLLEKLEKIRDRIYPPASSRNEVQEEDVEKVTVSYADLRAYEIHWLDVLKRFLPEDSTLLKEWYIHEVLETNSIAFDVAEMRKKVGVIRMVIDMNS